MIQYVVQPGDNLYGIGLRFKTNVTALMQLNQIKDPGKVYPGQILNIPLPLNIKGQSSQGFSSMSGEFPALAKGSFGPFVLLLQGQLARLGFYKGNMDGAFNNITEGSVIQFQISRNLQAAGYVTVDTWKHLLDETHGSLNAPLYHCNMLLSGLFMILSVDKPIYKPREVITMSLTKINLSNEPIKLNYSTGQRYDFKLSHSSGRTLWRWSDDKSFTQMLGSISISPNQTIRFTEQATMPDSAKENEIFHIYGWNTAKQINHIKLHVPIH